MDVYIYQAALLCRTCADATKALLAEHRVEDCGNSEIYPQGPYANGGGEADAPQHCDHCKTFLENPLTPEGIAFAKRAILKARSFAQEWAEFYQLEVEHE